MPVRDDQAVEKLYADFWHRQDALPGIFGLGLGLAGVRGYWPTSAFDGSGNMSDMSGQNRELTNDGYPEYAYVNLAPYVLLDGNDNFSRADEPGLSITGTEAYVDVGYRGLTMGCWVYFDNAIGATETLMAKWDTAVAANKSYRLVRLATGGATFQIYNAGIGAVTCTGCFTTAQQWYFIASRFTPSEELAIFVNGVWSTAATAIASITDTGEDFTLGCTSNLAEYMTGRLSNLWLCAMALPDERIESKYEWERTLYGV